VLVNGQESNENYQNWIEYDTLCDNSLQIIVSPGATEIG